MICLAPFEDELVLYSTESQGRGVGIRLPLMAPLALSSTSTSGTVVVAKKHNNQQWCKPGARPLCESWLPKIRKKCCRQLILIIVFTIIVSAVFSCFFKRFSTIKLDPIKDTF